MCSRKLAFFDFCYLFQGRMRHPLAFEGLKLQLKLAYVESLILVEIIDAESFGDLLLLF